MASSRQDSLQAPAAQLAGQLSASHPSLPLTAGSQENPQPPSLNINDLRAIAADIKDTLSAAIAELRMDIHTLNDRVLEVEKTTAKHAMVLRKATHRIDTHTLQLRETQRRIEDLDNRGRRHNLRIRGLPESIEADNLTSAVTEMFNNLLDRPPQTRIELERIHRALRPKGRENDPPRDIICCLVDYKLKEDILKQARIKQPLQHNGAHLQIFQDLSGITLQQRRDLKPLLDVLRANGIIYRWKFPFCLAATHLGRTAFLKVPEDLHYFCESLGIPLVEVPNWYADFRHNAAGRHALQEELMEAQDSRSQRRRSPSSSRTRAGHQEFQQRHSPTDFSRFRRARRDY